MDPVAHDRIWVLRVDPPVENRCSLVVQQHQPKNQNSHTGTRWKEPYLRCHSGGVGRSRVTSSFDSGNAFPNHKLHSNSAHPKRGCLRRQSGHKLLPTNATSPRPSNRKRHRTGCGPPSTAGLKVLRCFLDNLLSKV